jgi:hypothetical protein
MRNHAWGFWFMIIGLLIGMVFVATRPETIKSETNAE